MFMGKKENVDGTKIKKPIFKRVWFWILVIVVLLFACVGGGGSDSKTTEKVGEVATTATAAGETSSTESVASEAPAETETAAPETETEAPAPTEFYVGDIVRDGDTEIVYMSSGEYQEGNELMQPKDGYKYIFLQFAFKNVSDKSDTSISFYSFDAYADGYAADAYYGGSDDLSATLSPGRQTSGYLYFTVPEDAEQIEVEYTPNVFLDRKIKFIYEGEKDSGYILEPDATATEGALSVGESSESPKQKITYLSCEDYTSDNMFIQPKDGHHYIACTFEFENLSDSDQHISSFSFDCYADGVACEQSYVSGESLDATLSAGRKTKGQVVFEVPNDAEVIEVEYLTNFWTSNRVVFKAY